MINVDLRREEKQKRKENEGYNNNNNNKMGQLDAAKHIQSHDVRRRCSGRAVHSTTASLRRHIHN